MDGVRKDGQVDGHKIEPVSNKARRLQQPVANGTVLVCHAETARHLVQPLLGQIERNGLDAIPEMKISDLGEPLDAARLSGIANADALVIVISSRCQSHQWIELESTAALSAGVPVLVLLESPLIGWPASSVPTLITHIPDRLAAFLDRSRVDAMSLWEFAVNFFTDRATSKLFHRTSPAAWRWERSDIDMQAGEFGLSLLEDSASSVPQLRLVEARVQDGQTLMFLGSSDWKRYRLAWSPEIRAVIPAPAWPGAPAIGFMHCDFDSGREWARAGDPPVEIRLLGREIYGWHMSEYFWRAFVGSLPAMLGPTRKGG